MRHEHENSSEAVAQRRHLALALEVAVPLLMHRLEVLGEDERWDVREEWAHYATDVLAANGDSLVLGARKPAERSYPATSFAIVAKGVAALAYTPGGVLVAGTHWCVPHHTGGLHVGGPTRTWTCPAQIVEAATL